MQHELRGDYGKVLWQLCLLYTGPMIYPASGSSILLALFLRDDTQRTAKNCWQMPTGNSFDTMCFVTVRSCQQCERLCRSSLALANGVGASTIAFPAISCGVYGYPLQAACHVRPSHAWLSKVIQTSQSSTESLCSAPSPIAYRSRVYTQDHLCLLL